MYISRSVNLLHASIAAEPVSPDVAPKITIFLLIFSEALLSRPARSCIATSLKA